MITDRYPHGAPCWVEIVAPDGEAITAFYGGLFGWRFADGVARLDGQAVAGVGAPGRGDGSLSRRCPLSWSISPRSAPLRGPAPGRGRPGSAAPRHPRRTPAPRRAWVSSISRRRARRAPGEATHPPRAPGQPWTAPRATSAAHA